MSEKSTRPCIYRYILSETIGREISVPEVYVTYEDAYAEMRRRYLAVTGAAVDDDTIEPNYVSDNGKLLPDSAYAETANHDDADWKIERVPVFLTNDERETWKK